MSIVRTTLKELGPNLPLGIGSAGKLIKPFELRPYFTKFDRHLGEWKASNLSGYSDEAMVSAQISKLLSMLCLSVGGKSFTLTEDGNSTPEAELEVLQWWYADVMYMYVYARLQELGPEIQAPASCPHRPCNWKTDAAIFDFSEINVATVENIEDLHKWYKLAHPFKLRDGQTVLESVRIGPTRWTTMMKPGMLSGNLETVGFHAMQDSICGINGEDKVYMMAPSELDQLRKRDRVQIDLIADDVTGGVSFALTLPCPDCGGPIVNPLNWELSDFFSTSSPSGN